MTAEKKINRIIVKFGTSTLTAGEKSLSKPRMIDLVKQVSTLCSAGLEVVLVTSGGIVAGREKLNYPDLPKFLPAKQMLAAVGQPRLLFIYTQLFELFDRQIAQVLLTRDDFVNRKRYLNARNTIEALLEYGVIPIINENDTIATDEIRLGDNDNLSALVANLLEADLLILLTDQDGVFTADPRKDSGAKLISLISQQEIPEALLHAASGSANGLGTGGMSTKLNAADLARKSGTSVVIANGNLEKILPRLALNRESLGTWFTASGTHLENRKRFILSGLKETIGELRIDSGAVKALKNGGSLLPIGIQSSSGKFHRGDSVNILDPNGWVIGIGLSNYEDEDVAKIIGTHSDNIAKILGFAFGEEVIHRDNLVLFSR
ncbi:MAG: glutamate 5-kinase [Anaerolineaceae bacterium]|nr:glutamate 5-kinase [Anaerolineaceae bacterium]